jgi:hypothetical protein
MPLRAQPLQKPARGNDVAVEARVAGEDLVDHRHARGGRRWMVHGERLRDGRRTTAVAITDNSPSWFVARCEISA